MKPEVWPVIHVADSARAIACADVALRCGCAGVMMISMNRDNDVLDRVAVDVSNSRATGLHLGVNYLGLSSSDALLRSQGYGYDATWSDRQDFSRGEMSRDGRSVLSVMKPGHKFFAAVAFKGQSHDPCAWDSARLAAYYGLIPTTSGPGTGIAPKIDKITAIRRGLEPSDRLAIASGVTPENVAVFAPHVSHILVSTGISKTFHEFDEDRLATLMGTITAMAASP